MLISKHDPLVDVLGGCSLEMEAVRPNEREVVFKMRAAVH